MPIIVSCECGRQKRVPDDYAGKKVKCSACGKPQIVTAPARNSQAETPLTPADEPSRSTLAAASEAREIEIDLGSGVIFWCYGPETEPQTSRRIYYGTVGASPEFNSRIIERLLADLPRSIDSGITSLACSSSEWELIEFTEDRHDWLIQRLRAIVAHET